MCVVGWVEAKAGAGAGVAVVGIDMQINEFEVPHSCANAM